MSERYIDPNSGAATQPGGFSGPTSVRATDPEPKEVEEVEDSTEQEQLQETLEKTLAEFEQEPFAFEQPEEESTEQQQVEEEGSSEEGKYDELLSGSTREVKEYLEAHPDEWDAVIEAERQGKGRKGILDS